LSFDIAGFAQSVVERGQKWCFRAGRGAAEVADHRHRLLLRAQGACRRDRSGQQEYEVAALHHSPKAHFFCSSS
jgi:hypothetical protein